MKLRRFGVVSSPDGRLAAWQRACLDGLDAAGCGRPAWAAPSAGDVSPSWLWRVLERTAAARAPSPDWWVRALKTDRAPVDFVLCFGTPAAGMDPPPFGLWRLDVDGGLPVGWRSSANLTPSVRARLYADAAGERVMLQQGWLPVSLDYRDTRRRLFDTLAGWPARAAAEIQAGGWAALARVDADTADTRSVPEKCEHAPSRPAPPAENGRNLQIVPREARLLGAREALLTRAPSAYPSTREWLSWWGARPARRLWHWWREAARYDTWNVSIATLDGPLTDLRQLESLGATGTTAGTARWLPPRPPLYYLADPFPYRHDGRDWLLVEEYGHPKGVHGRIARVDGFDESSDESSTAIAPAIARDTHLSYPYTFQDGPHVLCAPEMNQEEGCIIYRLEAGGSWTPLYHVLRGRRVVDPTFFQHDGRWWLLCGDFRENTGNLTLVGYHADTLAGPWVAHALNPLKCDLASARPAGRPFTIGGHLYRPAQDCSQTYGGAVTVMRVEALGPTAFRETPALRLDPDPHGPYPDGRHHLVVDGTHVYSDGKKCRYDYLLWWRAWRF